jgi:hypothetical protein
MSQNNHKKSLDFFGKKNYTWMLVGAALILVGMLLMAGGKSSSPDVFDVTDNLGTFFECYCATYCKLVVDVHAC